jgi:hypothetical protein
LCENSAGWPALAGWFIFIILSALLSTHACKPSQLHMNQITLGDFFFLFFQIFLIYFFYNLSIKSTIEFEYSPTDFANLLADRPALLRRWQGSQGGASPLATMRRLSKYCKKGNYRGSPTYVVFTTPESQNVTTLKRSKKISLSVFLFFFPQSGPSFQECTVNVP